MTRALRSVVFDLDDTLTLQNSLRELACGLGVPAADYAAFMNDYHTGAIKPAALGEQLLSLLTSVQPKVARRTVDAVFNRIGVRPEASTLLSSIRSAGYSIGLISSSFERYVRAMAGRLGIATCYSNIRMEFDGADELHHIEVTMDAAGLKHHQLHDFCHRQGCAPDEVLVVGDNINDLEMFECTGNGVLIEQPHNHGLRGRAWHVVATLADVGELTAAHGPVPDRRMPGQYKVCGLVRPERCAESDAKEMQSESVQGETRT